MDQEQEGLLSFRWTEFLVLYHACAVGFGFIYVILYLIFAKIEASMLILCGYLILVIFLIFGVVWICKLFWKFVNRMLEVEDLTKCRNEYLIAFGTIGICSIILRVYVYFMKFNYESQMITALIYLVTTISVYCFFVLPTHVTCTWRQIDPETFFKYVRTTLLVHLVVFLASTKIAVEYYNQFESEKIIMCQLACSVASAFAFAEFARVWWVGVQLINVDEGMNAVVVQPVESRRAVNKISVKSEHEPLGKVVAPKPSCNICSIPYTENGIRTPRIIKACGHTICEQCADNLLKVKKDNFLKCPFCLKVTVVNGPAAILQKNFALLEYETEVVQRIQDIYKAARSSLASSASQS